MQIASIAEIFRHVHLDKNGESFPTFFAIISKARMVKNLAAICFKRLAVLADKGFVTVTDMVGRGLTAAKFL
jgi:hypothetical protein